MRQSKQGLDRFRRYDVKVVLPRIKLSRLLRKTSFKQKKTKYDRISNSSDKENNNSGSVGYSQPNLSLLRIEKVLNLDQRDGHLLLSAADRKLVGNIFNKCEKRTTEYSKVGSCRIESSEISNETVLHSESSGTCNINNVDVNNSASKHRKKKTKKEKNYRKDSGIGMESPKANRTKKRKLSVHLDYRSNDIQTTASTIHSSAENDIRDLEEIIQSHASHTCSDQIGHKINNVETIRTSIGLYVHRDFEIRMTQLCIEQPSKNSIPACTTSVIASTTRCENIEKSAKKEHRKVAVEKKIGINTRIKVGDREKNCTRIVESKFVETTEHRHKRIKLDEPSGMVTRRKAAVNLKYKFYALSNEMDCGFVGSPNVSNNQSDEQNQNQENDANQNKKSKPSSRNVLPKKRKAETANENKENEPKSLHSKSFRSTKEGKKKNTEKFENSAMNLKAKTGFKKVLKDVTLYRVENTQSWIDYTTRRFEHSIEKKDLQAPKDGLKKVSNRDRTANKPVQDVEVMISAKQLRHSTRTKKLLAGEDNVINNEGNTYSSRRKPTLQTNVKKLIKKSATKKNQDLILSTKLKDRDSTQQIKNYEVGLPIRRPNTRNNIAAVAVISPRPGCSGVSFPKGNKHDLEPSVKLKDREHIRPKKYEVELPKKSSKLPVKKLMKKSEALEKAERFNMKKMGLVNGDRMVLSKTASVLLEDVELSRSVTKFSSKPEINSSSAGPSGVMFSSKTPKSIPRRENENRNDRDPHCSPCILLNKLDIADISSYAITPLREDRLPRAPKSAEDYGIDDVNTDDSTDEEQNPKKIVPNWVKSAGFNSNVQFYFPRETILTWIRPPKKKFTLKNLFT